MSNHKGQRITGAYIDEHDRAALEANLNPRRPIFDPEPPSHHGFLNPDTPVERPRQAGKQSSPQAPPLASRAIRRACKHQYKSGYCGHCGTPA